MFNKLCLIYFSFSVIIFSSCELNNNKPLISESVPLTIDLSYAKHFNINKSDSIYHITVLDPWQSSKNTAFSYFFSSKSIKQNNAIQIPVKRVVCLSTSHIGFLSILNKQESIVGISGVRFVNDSTTQKLITSNKIADVGYEESLNYELILSLKPDLILAYGVESEKIGYITKLKDLGLPVVFIAEYLEDSPLAKAEWIKLFGVLFNKESCSDSIFSTIEKEYNNIKQIASKYKTKPSVFAGLPWKDSWFISGGNSNLAQLINDASGSYIWKEDTTHESFPLSLEAVFQKASEADFWINTGSANSLQEITNSDERLTLFKPFIKNNVYNNNFRINLNGGNDYWESGIVKPQIILQDLLEIFHPGTLQNHKLYFYKKLQ